MENIKIADLLLLNKALKGTISSEEYEIGILSNVTVNNFKEILEYECRVNGIEPVIEIGNYDNIVQDSLHFKSKNLVIIFYDLLNIIEQVSDYFEDIEDEKLINLKEKIFSELDIVFENLNKTSSVIFNSFSSAYFNINNFSKSKIEVFAKELNDYLLAKQKSNITVLNIDNIFLQIGIENAIDYRFYNLSKAPYKFQFYKNYVVAIKHVLLRNTGKLKKAIIFDCDNTLWKGVVGEDSIEGIDMSGTSKHGKFFRRVQQIAVFLSKRGVLIGICSKNNENEVLDVFQRHEDMILKEKHIVIKKINWIDKATNLRSIASELNIGLDSIVFIDDSNFEINLIKEQLPEVLAIQVPTSISDYPNFILKTVNTYFNLVSNNDDIRKTDMYKQQLERSNEKSKFPSIDDYLASLEIELFVLKNVLSLAPRVAQLTQKTNQFNLTTIRYTETQIEQFICDSKMDVYSINVKDKFGDSGLTGICIVKEDYDNPEAAFVDTLLMSCRVIGRNIEYKFMDFIIQDIASKGFKKLTATYIPSFKNVQVKSFYEKLGFTLLNTSNEGKKTYSLEINNYKISNIDYIKIVK